MKTLQSGLAACLLFCAGCAQTQAPDANVAGRKVEIDLTGLDADGLRGPPGGKVAVSYEFAIPDTADGKAAVRAIDPTVQFAPGSPGRIGATASQCLCIGSTHQKDYRDVLQALAELPYVERIIECHFE